MIVSEVPGTTRDSVDVRFEKEGKTLVVIDTAGVRKKRRMVASDIDFYSFHRAQRSVRRADKQVARELDVSPKDVDRVLAESVREM